MTNAAALIARDLTDTNLIAGLSNLWSLAAKRADDAHGTLAATVAAFEAEATARGLLN